jgi:predicted DNA-binding WGR domain protein
VPLDWVKKFVELETSASLELRDARALCVKNHLQAINDAHNNRRLYCSEWDPDLLSDRLVQTDWGRIRRSGQSRTKVLRDEDSAKTCVRQPLDCQATSGPGSELTIVKRPQRRR